MLNLQTYHQGYAYDRYSKATNYDELLTAFVESVESISTQYLQHKFDITIKNVAPDDLKLIEKHKTALPIELGLDSNFKQFSAFILDDDERQALIDLYKKSKRGKQLPDTALNRLTFKLANSRRIISYFRESHRLIVKQYYFYENNLLHINSYVRIKFNPNTTSDLILKSFFKNKSRPIKSEIKNEQLIKKMRKFHPTIENDDLANKLERSCEYINTKVKDKTKSEVGLISHTNSVIQLNASLIQDL